MILCVQSSSDVAADMQIQTLVIDGQTFLLPIAGAALADAEVVDGNNADLCVDAIGLLRAANVSVPAVWASNGGDIVITLSMAKGTGVLAASDTLDSVRAVGTVDGSGTLRVVSTL